MTGNNEFIIEEKELPKLMIFGSIPEPSREIAIVYCDKSGNLTTVYQNNKLTKSEMLWGKYEKFYKVDLRPKTLEYTQNLRSDKETFDFVASITLNYSASSPDLVVSSPNDDIKQIIKCYIMDEAENYTQDNNVENKKEVEKTLKENVTITYLNVRLNGTGYKVDYINIRLDLNKPARNHIEELTKLRREQELNIEKLKAKQTEIDFRAVNRQAGKMIDMVAPEEYEKYKDIELKEKEFDIRENSAKRRDTIDLINVISNSNIEGFEKSRLMSPVLAKGEIENFSKPNKRKLLDLIEEDDDDDAENDNEE